MEDLKKLQLPILNIKSLCKQFKLQYVESNFQPKLFLLLNRILLKILISKMDEMLINNRIVYYTSCVEKPVLNIMWYVKAVLNYVI